MRGRTNYPIKSSGVPCLENFHPNILQKIGFSSSRSNFNPYEKLINNTTKSIARLMGLII
jgi:hypothetical protein